MEFKIEQQESCEEVVASHTLPEVSTLQNVMPGATLAGWQTLVVLRGAPYQTLGPGATLAGSTDPGDAMRQTLWQGSYVHLERYNLE